MKNAPSARLPGFSVLLSLCMLLSVQHLSHNNIGLRHNFTLIGLWKTVSLLSPPQAEELIGLQQRPRRELSDPERDLLQKVDGESVLRGALLALQGHPVEAQTRLSQRTLVNALDRYWLALALGQQGQASAAIQVVTGVDGMDRYFELAGFEAQSAGRFEQASRLLTVAANLDDGMIQDRSLVYEYLAKNAYNHASDWDQSFHWAERWIQAVPDNTYAYTWLAGLHLWRGESETAYNVLQRGEPYGVQQNPYYPGQLGQIYQSRGQWQPAIEQYRQSWELHKDVPWMHHFVAWSLGNALYHEGQLAEAKPYLGIAAQEGIQPAADILARMELQ